MHPARHIRRLADALAGLAGALLAFAAAAPAAPAGPFPPRPPGWGNRPPPPHRAGIGTVVVRGTPGWPTALITAGAALARGHGGGAGVPGTGRPPQDDHRGRLTHAWRCRTAGEPGPGGTAAGQPEPIPDSG